MELIQDEINKHVRFCDEVNDYIDDCLIQGLSKGQIMKSFEKFIDGRLKA
jgi:hypothetical protein